MVDELNISTHIRVIVTVRMNKNSTCMVRNNFYDFDILEISLTNHSTKRKCCHL